MPLYPPASSAGAPDSADYLVGTSNGSLSGEIVVGATPGGELGGTWGSPTVDATHSGSAHAGLSGQPGSTDVAVADGGTGASAAAAAATNLGLGTADSPQFAGVNVGHASDTTVTRTGAGDIAVEGNALYRAGGTDVAIADGGTGASTATAGFDALSPMTTAGDIIVGGVAGTRTRLAKGSDSQVLTVDPGTHLLAWANSAAGFSDPMTTRGDIIVRDSSNATARLGRGSASQVLTSDGTDVAWATPSGSGALTLLASSVLGSPAASFTFASISGAYNHLRVMVVGRCSAAVFDSSVLLRFNSDSGANYDRYLLQGASATTASAAESFAQTSVYAGTVVGASGPASIPGIVIADIPLYAGTTFHKTVMRLSGEVGQSTGNDRLEYGVATWRSTAAVTQIDLTLGSGTNFITGSAAYLYGLL